MIGVAVTVTGRPVLVPVPVAVTRPVPSSWPAELAVVSVAAVCRLTDDNGRALCFDRALGRRGMATAGRTRRRGGDRGQRPGRHCRCRGRRR